MSEEYSKINKMLMASVGIGSAAIYSKIIILLLLLIVVALDYATGYHIKVYSLYYILISYASLSQDSLFAILVTALSVAIRFAMSIYEADLEYYVDQNVLVNSAVNSISYVVIYVMASALRTMIISIKRSSNTDPFD